MIDFSKIGTGNTVDTVLPPREIFNALPSKDAKKFQYPRDVQSQVWAKWFDRRNDKSLVIKMNTGSGKTVVGLLILKSCLNEGKSPAVYVCPDKYLVKQALDAANELGIEVASDVDDPRFLSGKAILVINVYKLINGKSVFGVGDEGIKQSISSLVIDDAHACLETIEDQFTIKIPRGTDTYDKLFNIFKNGLHSQCESKTLEIEDGDPTSYLQVPYWTWQEKITEIREIFTKNRDQKYLKFVWPLVKENIELSHCVVGSNEIEISPHFIPIHMIPSIIDSDRKIFMTATLVDDSILSSHFSVDKEDIKNPVVPDSAGDIGDRMIFLPQAINPEISDDDIKEYCKKMSSFYNVVVIVPSQNRADYWKNVADATLTKENIYEGVENLKKNLNGLTVLVNRYDGIDLPGDACRILVIDGYPDVRRKIDKVFQSILLESTRYANQVIQRIEQGIGRGIRSNDDHCIIFLVGRDLTRQLYSKDGLSKLSPGTKAQLELSEQVSEQIRGKPISDLTEIINYCLKQNKEWVTKSKGVLASLKYDEEIELDDITIVGRNAYDQASIRKFQEAVTLLTDLVNSVKDKNEKGLIKQLLAEYVNFYDKSEAQKIQMSAANDNRRVLKPIKGIQYHKITGDVLDQAKSCSNFLNKNYKNPNDLIIEVHGILDKLQFENISANIFEEELKKIAQYLGFESQRPEQEYKKGPDVLWNIGQSGYLVIECKNEATTENINKTDCNQLNGSCEWFESKYGNSFKYTPIMVHPSKTFHYAASPNQNIRIITEDKLKEFCRSVKDFIQSIASENDLGNHEAIRNKIINYNLQAALLVKTYTVKFTKKNNS